MLVKQLIVFILPIAVEGSDEEGVEQKKTKKTSVSDGLRTIAVGSKMLLDY